VTNFPVKFPLMQISTEINLTDTNIKDSQSHYVCNMLRYGKCLMQCM